VTEATKETTMIQRDGNYRTRRAANARVKQLLLVNACADAYVRREADGWFQVWIVY
jgi:hypothetical protein